MHARRSFGLSQYFLPSSHQFDIPMVRFMAPRTSRGAGAPTTANSPRPTSFVAGGELPIPESVGRRTVVHVVVLVALTASLAYLTWRVGFTLGRDLWLSIPMWLLELHAVASLAIFTISLWDVDSIGAPAPVERTDLRIAVLIPTYNEPAEVLLPTIAAAVVLQPSHETWVLDDGRRPWVRELARSLGAHYLARSDNRHAKAGNLNPDLLT